MLAADADIVVVRQQNIKHQPGQQYGSGWQQRFGVDEQAGGQPA